MMIAVARHFKRAGIVPPRDLVFAFVAGRGGRREIRRQVAGGGTGRTFDGITEAVGEVGDFSLTVPRRDGGSAGCT